MGSTTIRLPLVRKEDTGWWIRSGKRSEIFRCTELKIRSVMIGPISWIKKVWVNRTASDTSVQRTQISQDHRIPVHEEKGGRTYRHGQSIHQRTKKATSPPK